MDDKEKKQLEKKLKQLKKKKGKGTELISIYIPGDHNISQEVSRLRTEYSEAANIKSKSTRKNVQAALKSIIHALTGVKKPPKNGVAIFCGYIAGDVKQYRIIPPNPIKINLYRCDSRFYLEPLEKLVESKEKYGLVTIDGKDATIAKLTGKNLEIRQRFSSSVPSKHTKGGWSQRRFERLINEARHEFLKKVGDAVNHELDKEEIKGVILGGPGQTKDDLASKKYLTKRVKDKIIGKINTGYSDESGVKELMEKSEEVIEDLEVQQEREIVNEFLRKLVDSHLATYGLREVVKALEEGKVDKLLLSDELEWAHVELECPSCGEIKKELVKDWDEFEKQGKICPECNNEMKTKEEKDVSDELEKMAEETGSEILYISTETDKGKQFYQAFGGIAAILRY